MIVRPIDADKLMEELKTLPMMSNWGEAFVSELIQRQPTIVSTYLEVENQKTHILKKEDMYSLYPEKTQVRSHGLDELCPIGIMWFMASDPNQTDEVPGEWEMVSKLWKRIK